MEMTPRQRWLALLAGKPVDRIPTDYQATAEVTERVLQDLDCPDEESLWQKLHIDRRRFVEPKWKRAHHPNDPQADLWGIRYRKADYGGGAYDEPSYQPLAAAQTVADVHAHHWPDPDDFDYRPITETLAADDGFRPIHAGCYEPFLLYGYLRGLQQAFEDLVLNPDIADAILGHIFDFYDEHHRRIFEAGQGRIDLTWVAEDLGAQTGPLMSLATYRRFLLPNQIKMADLARSHGVHVMYHTDGARPAVLARPDRPRGDRDPQSDPVALHGDGTREAGRRVRLTGGFSRLDRQPADAGLRVGGGCCQRSAGKRGDLCFRPLDLRPLPQSPAGQPHGEHRGDVRDDSCDWAALGSVAFGRG